MTYREDDGERRSVLRDRRDLVKVLNFREQSPFSKLSITVEIVAHLSSLKLYSTFSAFYYHSTVSFPLIPSTVQEVTAATRRTPSPPV